MELFSNSICFLSFLGIVELPLLLTFVSKIFTLLLGFLIFELFSCVTELLFWLKIANLSLFIFLVSGFGIVPLVFFSFSEFLLNIFNLSLKSLEFMLDYSN